MKHIRRLAALAVAAFGLSTALAASGGGDGSQPSTIDPVQPFAWGVNVGWLLARPDAAYGVRTADTTCSGYMWSANVGWINLGTGAPADGWHYANFAGDWGVNVQPDGTLRGFAWGANIGWVNFETTGNPRINLATGIFVGYAWSPNVGWLNLGDANFHPTTTTLAITDTDGDGISDAWEFQKAGNLTTLSHGGDADGDGVSDYYEFLADTDPLNPNDSMRIIRYDITRPGGVPTQNLQFTSQPSRLYRIETRLSLTDGIWEDTGLGLFSGQPASTLMNLGSPVLPQRFYRITAQRPLAP